MIWDEDKREKVIRERNIDFAKILDIFDDPFAVDFQDLEHSTADETRYKIIGMTGYYGLITLVYTISDNQDRFITAWKSDEWETNEYEQNKKW
jgi:uncharacterized protein